MWAVGDGIRTRANGLCIILYKYHRIVSSHLQGTHSTESCTIYTLRTTTCSGQNKPRPVNAQHGNRETIYVYLGGRPFASEGTHSSYHLTASSFPSFCDPGSFAQSCPLLPRLGDLYKLEFARNWGLYIPPPCPEILLVESRIPPHANNTDMLGTLGYIRSYRAASGKHWTYTSMGVCVRNKRGELAN